MANQKIFAAGSNLVSTIIGVVILIAIWVFGKGVIKIAGKATEITTPLKVIVSILIIVVLAVMWIMYYTQKQQDSSSGGTRGTSEKVLSAYYKVGGWGYRIKAIGLFIGSALTFVLGVVLLVMSATTSNGAFVGFAVVLLVISIITLLTGLYHWKRSKSLVQGKYY